MPVSERIKHHKVVQWMLACSCAGAAVVSPRLAGFCGRRSFTSGVCGYATSVVDASQSGNWLRPHNIVVQSLDRVTLKAVSVPEVATPWWQARRDVTVRLLNARRPLSARPSDHSGSLASS